MTTGASEFEFVDPSELRTPEVEFYQDRDSDGREVIVAHEALNPYGWVASTAWTEVSP